MVASCGRASEVGMRSGMDVKLSCAGWCATTTARGAPWPAFGALGALAIGDDCRRCGRATVVRCSAEQRTVRRRRRLEISHNADVAATSVADREEYVRRGQRLEYFTIGYNSLGNSTAVTRYRDEEPLWSAGWRTHSVRQDGL